MPKRQLEVKLECSPPKFFDLSDFFSDPRYRGERILLVIFIPGSILLIGAVIWLLATQEWEIPTEKTILTADQVESGISPSEEVVPDAFQVAMEAVFAKDYPRAEALLHEYIATGIHPERAWTALGIIARDQNNLEQAMEYFGKAIEIGSDAQALFLRGQVLWQMDRKEEALADVTSAADLNPSNPLYTNAKYLYMISLGNGGLVRQSIELKLQIGLTSGAAGWIAAAAALEIDSGNPDAAASVLVNALQLLKEEEFEALLEYEIFQEQRNHPALLPFFIKTSTVRQSRGRE